MYKNHLIGQKGETFACRFLTQKGYALLERNWMSNHHEIDIIAKHLGVIVFIEVKTQTQGSHQSALSRIYDKKLKNIIQAARDYMHINHLDLPMRLDTITIIGEEPNLTLKHLIGAYIQDEIIF